MSAGTHRTTFLVGLAASVAVLTTAAVTGRSAFLSAGGGLFGVTITRGVLWLRTRDRRR